MEFFGLLQISLTAYIALLLLSVIVPQMLLALSVRYSVRANSIRNGEIYSLMTLCFGFIPAIVYACVKSKLAAEPIDTPQKLADKKRSTTCIVLAVVLGIVLFIAAIGIVVAGTVMSVSAM